MSTSEHLEPTPSDVAASPAQRETIDVVDAILREWLADREAMLVVGQWGDGAVAEILPRGKARLSKAGYDGRFSGLRDLRIEGEHHHMHLDLSKFERVRYTVRGSVCYGWRPSLEVDLVGASETPCFSISAGHLYDKERLRTELAERYFQRLFDHRRRYGELVEVFVRPTRAPVQDVSAAWRDVAACYGELHGTAFDAADPVGSLRSSLEQALAELEGNRAEASRA